MHWSKKDKEKVERYPKLKHSSAQTLKLFLFPSLYRYGVSPHDILTTDTSVFSEHVTPACPSILAEESPLWWSSSGFFQHYERLGFVLI